MTRMARANSARLLLSGPRAARSSPSPGQSTLLKPSSLLLQRTKALSGSLLSRCILEVEPGWVQALRCLRVLWLLRAEVCCVVVVTGLPHQQSASRKLQRPARIRAACVVSRVTRNGGPETPWRGMDPSALQEHSYSTRQPPKSSRTGLLANPGTEPLGSVSPGCSGMGLPHCAYALAVPGAEHRC